MADTSRRPMSQQQFERAQHCIPGGVNSPARAFGAVGGIPPFIAKGVGPLVTDIDGNEYIDYVGSWGPHILGHQHPAVVEAIQQAVPSGTSFGAPTVAESDLAELVCELVPSIERVRMVNSGTEATMSAIRLARGFTSRDRIIKFAGCYHGHVDSLLVQAGSGALTLGTPSSPGVPAGCTSDTLILPFNDTDGLEAAFREYGESLAAVILEPVCGNMGCVIPHQEFLASLRRLCSDHGTILIFDEVMTGFRVALRCAQHRFGVIPDMTTLGKIIGGGMPVGAYGGRAEIMNFVSPTGQVYQAGTLSGNPVAVASGLATLQTLQRDDPYGRLEDLASRLESGLLQAASTAAVPVCVNRVGSMLTLFFSAGPVTDLSSATASDTDRFAKWFHGMLNRGVYLPCSQFEAMFVSARHSVDQIDKTVAAASEMMRELAA